MTAAKAYKASSPTLPAFPADYTVVAVQDLNFTDVVNNNNKYYHLEVQVAKNGVSRVHSEYGRVGAKSPAREYRYASGEHEARAIYESIICEKTGRSRDPYVKVDLCRREVGSAEAKGVVKPWRLAGAPVSAPAPPTMARSALHPEVQRVVSRFFAATGHFVEANLKCPLGQLSREQIDQGRLVLDRAKALLNAGAGPHARHELSELTNQFYSLIPHNFGYTRLDPDALRLDALGRIAQKEADLDVFLDAKSVAKALAKGAAVDEQYASLGAELTHVPPSSPTFRFVDTLVHSTRAKNHGFLGKIAVTSVLAVRRKGEGNFSAPTPFLDNAERIAHELSGGSFLRRTSGGSAYDAPHVKRVEDRPDLDPRLGALYAAANVWPAWHGTRNANMTGVLSRGLLIRPAGAVHAGSMFGDGIYFAHQSTKAINYTSARGSYWASGADDVGYLLLADVAFGKMHVAGSSHFFRAPPAGCHSVYGMQGQTTGLVNDEMIVYQPTGPAQQHAIRYVVEIRTDPSARV